MNDAQSEIFQINFRRRRRWEAAQEDIDLDDHEAHEHAPTDDRTGNVLTAIKVWHTSIKFWNGISKRVPGALGDYDQEALKV